MPAEPAIVDPVAGRAVDRVTDVLVIGAGPAGSAAARVLASAGRDVTIVDKATFPRDKCCGDGLTTLGLRELETIGFDPGDVPSWTAVDAAWLRSPSGREVRLPLEGVGQFAAVTPRLELDDALLRHAAAAGATVLDGHGFARFVDDNVDDAVEPDSVAVEIDGIGIVSARYVVAADGMWSPVRKAMGLATPGYLGEWHGFRQYASGVTGPAKDRLYVWFDADLIPGYAWSFPLPDGRVNIGFGLLRDGRRKVQDMKTIWPDLLQRPHIREALGPHAVMEDRHTAWPIPARIDTATLAAGRVLFVGDAATATDALTGEGIGQALLTGRLAAEAILAGGGLDAATVRTHYEHHVAEHLVADHRMSVALSRVLASERGARGAVRVVDVNAWTRRNFARWMFEDEPRAVALTPSRWHRAMFRRAGAYAGRTPTVR
ncbi:MAG: putative oxidoreductase [Ilumatobacteraceae bacterium]|nr:putative oxidoreductase [Ilumatobacteraceae bacterium]